MGSQKVNDIKKTLRGSSSVQKKNRKDRKREDGKNE